MGRETSVKSERDAVVVYAALFLFSLAWLGLIFAPPQLMAAGHWLSATVLYKGFSAVCHQIPERSFHLHDFPLAVCSRCTGIYVGFMLGLMLYPFVRSLRAEIMPHRRWLLLAAAPMLTDFGGGVLGLFTNTFFSRTATGALLGSVAAFYLQPAFISTFQNFSTEIHLWRKLITKSLPSSAGR
ncbi:MAG TPA: DUF2085 domain-containing protein [Blastocatellia bacterium]|nr:DUF2085 domain-containing protein [Blastocatellia bacterium]HMV84530.1 DUF2085 domain-containing protein [Blastocatellia bacterium]HMX27775.1 DUF2085 domain-containing protein [Blastocatellia bacterium]HMY76095.1 DUF2085 domain-containing protein [Blastocatellia bacterium]HMZ17320.1 DUF2085 domain-containing protein [Blastocatellia bacterium]